MNAFNIDYISKLSNGGTDNFPNTFCIESTPCIQRINEIRCIKNLCTYKINQMTANAHAHARNRDFTMINFQQDKLSHKRNKLLSHTTKLIFLCLYAEYNVETHSFVEFIFVFQPVNTIVVFQFRLNFSLSQSLCGSSNGMRKFSPFGVRKWKFIKWTLGVTIGLITFKWMAALPAIDKCTQCLWICE